MQREIYEGCRMAARRIDDQAGRNVVRVAPIGRAFEQAKFNSELYDDDNYHASNRGILLAALVLFSTIYDASIREIDLAPICASLGLCRADGEQLSRIAQAAIGPPR